MSRACELLCANDEIGALDYKCFGFLLTRAPELPCWAPAPWARETDLHTTSFGDGINLMLRWIFEKIRRSCLKTFKWGRPMSSITALLAHFVARVLKSALFPPTGVTLKCALVTCVHASLKRRVSGISLLKFRKVSRCERYGYSWFVSPTFRPLSSSPISRIIEWSVKLIGTAVFASMFVSSALVIMTSTCKHELFRSKYRSLAPVTVNSMAAPGVIVASDAYSRLNSFLITFYCIIDPNRSTSLVICFVISPPIVAIITIINNWSLVRWILGTFGCLIY